MVVVVVVVVAVVPVLTAGDPDIYLANQNTGDPHLSNKAPESNNRCEGKRKENIKSRNLPPTYHTHGASAGLKHNAPKTNRETLTKWYVFIHSGTCCHVQTHLLSADPLLAPHLKIAPKTPTQTTTGALHSGRPSPVFRLHGHHGCGPRHRAPRASRRSSRLLVRARLRRRCHEVTTRSPRRRKAFVFF